MVVNVAALDLGLGSGGFDVVHVNLTRGLEGGGPAADEHVIKLNYTSLQHPVAPVESLPIRGSNSPERRKRNRGIEGRGGEGWSGAPPCIRRSSSCPCTATWRRPPGRRRRRRPACGSATCRRRAGRCPARSRATSPSCASAGCSAATSPRRPPTAASTRRSSTVGALDAAGRLGWDAVLVGPGPGIIGSDTEFGHGGMAALDSAHAALSLRLPTLLSPRLSSATRANATSSVSHHTYTVLELLLAAVEVAVPGAGGRDRRGARGRARKASPAQRARRPRRLRRVRPADTHDGARPRRGPAVLRRAPGRRSPARRLINSNAVVGARSVAAQGL